MAELFGKKITKQELIERVGTIAQIAGVKKVRFADGPEEGVEACIFRTGSGLSFTVAAGRGMDISHADWCGRTLGFMTSVGEISSKYYEPEGKGWLRSFFGGLLTTCGLTQVGSPCEDNEQRLGLHGRISNIPSRNFCCGSEWQGDDYVLWAQGEVRETAFYGENLLLTRRISAKLGENIIWINDTVENQGFEPTPHMILYHFNAGFPCVDAGSKIILPTASATPRDSGYSEDGYDIVGSPTTGCTERVYYHEMNSDANGKVTTGIVNPNIGDGFGFYIRYNKNELPFFTQWKLEAPGKYVIGLEPGNCHVEGRVKERERGTLQMLSPGEKRSYSLEIGVITSYEELESITK